MNVGVGCTGQIEVDDMFDIGDIESTGGDIGRDEYTVGRGFKTAISFVPGVNYDAPDSPVEILQSLLLLQLRVEREDGHLERLEQGDQSPDTVDRSDKHERSAGVSKQEVV